MRPYGQLSGDYNLTVIDIGKYQLTAPTYIPFPNDFPFIKKGSIAQPKKSSNTLPTRYVLITIKSSQIMYSGVPLGFIQDGCKIGIRATLKCNFSKVAILEKASDSFLKFCKESVSYPIRLHYFLLLTFTRVIFF